MSLSVEYLIVVAAAMLVGAALIGLLALLAGVGGKLTHVARTLLVGGGTLWILSLLAEIVWPVTTASGGVGRLHLWFSGITALLALLTLVSLRLARKDKRNDGRYETIGYVLTGMLAVIAVFYAHAAVFAPPASSTSPSRLAAPSDKGTCEVPEIQRDRLDAPALCAAPTFGPLKGASHAAYTPPARPAMASARE